MTSGSGMDPQASRLSWRVVGKSVRGSSHVRAGLPNQDAIGWRPDQGGGLPLMLGVSDGHGSPKAFRSDTGSNLAVTCTLDVLSSYLESLRVEETTLVAKRRAQEKLPGRIVQQWREAVDVDLAARKLQPDELAALEEKVGDAGRQLVENNPHLAYGATILGVAVTEEFIVYLQNGDGDILVVFDDGKVEKPLPGDPRLIANETTSLSGRDAWRDFRLVFQRLGETVPALILASTDGYSNSFATPEGFLQVGSDLLDMIRSEGLEEVEASLDTWLRDASQQGSGDDVTLGIISSIPGPL